MSEPNHDHTPEVTSTQESVEKNGNQTKSPRIEISSKIASLIYGQETPKEKDGSLREDKIYFIRALLSSHIPAIGHILILWLHAEINRIAAERAREVVAVSEFVDDIVSDGHARFASALNMAMTTLPTFLFYDYIFNLINSESSYTKIIAGLVTLINFSQAWRVNKISKDDLRATAKSGGQKLYDMTPISHHAGH